MLSKALEDSCKSLAKFFLILFEKRLMNCIPKTRHTPNLHNKRTLETNMSKVLMRTITTHITCGTLHSFILKPNSGRKAPMPHSLNQIIYFWRHFLSLNTRPISRPSKVRSIHQFFYTQSVSTLDGI